MAVNPMQRKARNSFLLGMILTLIITGVVIALLFLQLKKVKDEQAAEAAKLRNVYTLKYDVKSGEILTEDMFEMITVSEDTIPKNATSLSTVIDAWYLQTEDGKTISRDEEGLYINETDNLMEVDSSQSNSRNTYTYDDNGTILYFMSTTNSEGNDVTRLYEEMNTGNVYKYVLNNGTITREFIKLNSVPLLAKIDIKAKTVITDDYVVQSDEVTTDDLREEEYNMIVLPVDLETNDYIDIRLMLPNGQNFIVISKAKVEVPENADGTYVADTIKIKLREDEILSISSAIVEAYGIEGAYLYATKYVEAGLQGEAIPTYVPNAEVSKLLGYSSTPDGRMQFTNPAIIETAKEELRRRYANTGTRNESLQPMIDGNEDYPTNVQDGLNEGTAKSQEARANYLELLTAQ